MYRTIGRLPGAIEHAVRDFLVRQHLPDELDISGKLAALFSHLVDMREMETRPMPVRMTRRKTELVRHGVDTRAIDALIDARVLHVGDHGGEGVMLAHDALFREMEAPLTEWIAQNQSDTRI